MRFLFLNSVIDRILEDWHRFRRIGLESGGILVGPKFSRIVTHVIFATDNARRSAASYVETQADADHFNRELRGHHKNGFDCAGYVHFHPDGCPRLSGVDRETCKSILTDPGYALSNRLLMLVISECGDSGPIFAYLASLAEDTVKIEPVEIVKSPDPAALKTLSFIDFRVAFDAYMEKQHERHEENSVAADSRRGAFLSPGDPDSRDFQRAYRRFREGRKLLNES